MTNEEIQAIRKQYNYEPSTLNTGVSSPSDTNTRLAAFRGETTAPQEKPSTSLTSKAKTVVGGVASGVGTDLALSAIDVAGRKAVEALPDDFQVAGITKQQMLENLSKAPKLREQFETEYKGENDELYNASQIAGTVSAVAPAVKMGVVKLAETKAGQKVVGKVAETLGKTKGKITEKIAERNVGKVTEIINPTEDIMTPLQRKQAITEGRQTIKTTKLGGTEVGYTPTEETKRAANILSKTIKSGDKPNVVFAKTKAEIAKRGAEAESYLAKNPVKITNAEEAEIFANVRKQAEKNLTETELKAYDEQIKLFQKQLVGRKGGYTTENYYKAIKDWEDNIAEHLPKGKEAILDPSGVASAKIHAASDIRKAVRDLIGSKHPEFKDKMYDIASLYEAKGNALQIAAKQKSKTFLEKNPKIRKAIEYGAAGTIIGGGFNILKD